MPTDKYEIISSNLHRLDADISAAFEKAAAHLSDVAALLCDEAGEDEIFFRDAGFIEKYREITNDLSRGISENAAPINKNKIRSLTEAVSPWERALICSRMTDLLGIKGIESAGTFFDESVVDENEKISYMKSSYTDTAYRLFAAEMKNPKVVYGNDFSEVCENVYYEKSAYCILPIENTTDGRLGSFRRLIMKYGLKTVAVCRVETSNGESTVFALMKKYITIPDGIGKKYFGFGILSADALPTVMTAAAACGMKPVNVTSVSDGGYDIALEISDAGICGFLSFLCLEFPDFIPEGIFCKITR